MGCHVAITSCDGCVGRTGVKGLGVQFGLSLGLAPSAGTNHEEGALNQPTYLKVLFRLMFA